MVTLGRIIIAVTLAAMLGIVGCAAQNAGEDMHPADDRQVSWGSGAGSGI